MQEQIFYVIIGFRLMVACYYYWQVELRKGRILREKLSILRVSNNFVSYQKESMFVGNPFAFILTHNRVEKFSWGLAQKHAIQFVQAG